MKRKIGDLKIETHMLTVQSLDQQPKVQSLFIYHNIMVTTLTFIAQFRNRENVLQNPCSKLSNQVSARVGDLKFA